MAVAEQIDFDAVFEDIAENLRRESEDRLFPPLIRLWDSAWNLRGHVACENSGTFQWLRNDVGTGEIELPLDYFMSEWLIDVDARQTTNVHVTVDKDGARWGGRMANLRVVKGDDGRKVVRVQFKHDMEELHHILVWANPFLPPEMQFPKLWVLFGHSKWALKTTLMCQLMRLESSAWFLPNNPMDPGSQGGLDNSRWWNVVKPDFDPDTSVAAIVHSRFKTMFETSKRIADDAQLTWECRRYLDGDPPPWPGANLRHGCLVWDLVDKSGWNTGTSFGGSFFDGLLHELTNIGGDGVTENQEQLPNPNVPDSYFQPGWRGTHPSMPGVVFFESEATGISSSEYYHQPATDTRVVAGGHSMPGVNEAISAAINMVGDLTAMIPGVPPLGGVADAVLKPLYTDVFLAFGQYRNTVREQRTGPNHYYEKWADGGDRAYTLAWLLAMRTGMWQTRELNRASITVEDGCPYRVGENGWGDFFLGDRVAFNVEGMPPGKLYVECVSELKIEWARDKAPVWVIQIGQREPEDPIIKAYEMLQEFLGIMRDLGVL